MDRGKPNRRRPLRRALLVPLVASVLLFAFAAAAQAKTIVVTTTADPTGANDCATTDMSCSLRQAVGAAASGDTIQLVTGIYTLTQGTDIDVTTSVKIEGNDPSNTSIDGSQNLGSIQSGESTRILRVDNPAQVTIQGLTLTHGIDENDEACPSGCDSIDANGGGALFNNGGTVTLDDVAFTNNSGSATPLGGAVSNSGGSLTMNGVSFTQNSAGSAGALFIRSGTVTGNAVTFDSDSTTCCNGGALYQLGGTTTLTNTTVVNSSGLDGTAAFWTGGGTLTLDNDTFSDDGADIATDRFASTVVENTILGRGSERGACEQAGDDDELNNETTGAAITTPDGGYNIDEDTSCNLSGTGDQSKADPMIVPIFDNGGPTQTEALIAGSPALGDPATTHCPTTDARGESRPASKCDIGAFEADVIPPPTGTPTASTGDASNVTDTSADLASTINLAGEAGGFHFVYGTSPDQLTSSSPVVAAGVVSSDTDETETLSNLTPGTTYYYDAVADNATASTLASNPVSFKTDAGPPVISDVNVASVTDTTATIDFTIDPAGADAQYFVEYGHTTDYDRDTQPVDIGPTPGPQNLSVTLTDLDPASTYHFDLLAVNSVQQVDSGDNQFGTDQQVAGTAGMQVTVTDGAFTDGECPSGGDTTVDWGDHFSDTNADIECDGGSFTLTDTHTYAGPGRYLIQIEYGDLDSVTDEYAEIDSPAGAPTNSSPPTISGLAQDGQILNATTGGWAGAGTFHYQWLDCDGNGENCADTGDDASEYTPTADEVGDTIRVIVFASNDSGEIGATSDQTDVVQQAGPPSNTAPPVITGTAQQGHTLATTNGTWDGDPTSFDYQWQDCDAGGQRCASTGTDANTYTLGASDVGQTVQVIVTATNDGGSTPQTSNLTAAVQAANPPAPSSLPPATPSPPTVATTAPTVSVTSAGFSGAVAPNGLATQAFFEYGLDPKYSGGGPVVYDQSTPAQSVGAGFASDSIGPVAVTGLLPNALYHVRLVATNSDGTTTGPDVTFTTEAAPAPPAPTLAQTFNVAPISGFVLIKINGKFVPLTGLDQIPSGAQIDARHGSLELITSTGVKGKTQHGTFGGAIFQLTQERSGKTEGLVTLTLLEGLFKGAPSYALCTRHKAGDASAAAASSKTLQLLHASAHGKFRTKGRYSAATVLGTKWTIADRCDGTLVHDITDSVAVNDFVRHKTIILHAGQSYLARARP